LPLKTGFREGSLSKTGFFVKNSTFSLFFTFVHFGPFLTRQKMVIFSVFLVIFGTWFDADL